MQYILKLFYRSFILFLLALTVSINLYAQRCEATTKKGTQCKRNAQSGSVYCWQHRAIYEQTPSKATPKKIEDIKPVEKENLQPNTNKSVNEYRQCQATTKKGKQCSRRAKEGSNYCWQHGR